MIRTRKVVTAAGVLLYAGVAMAQNSAPSLSEAMNLLHATADTWPPRFASDAQRVEVLRVWRLTEARAVQSLESNAAPGADIHVLLGELYRIGHNLDIAGSHEKALTHLQQAATLEPTNPKPHLLLGRHLTFRGDLTEGEIELLRAYVLTPGDQLIDLYYLLANNHYLQKHYALALLFANRIPAGHPASEAIAVLRDAAERALNSGVEPKTIELNELDPLAPNDVILRQ